MSVWPFKACPDCGGAVIAGRTSSGQTVVLDGNGAAYSLGGEIEGQPDHVSVMLNRLTRVPHGLVCPKRKPQV